MEKTFSYFVVAIDYGRKGIEAVVDPEITRREVVSRLISGEYRNIKFIHKITMNDVPADVTDDLLTEAFGATHSSIVDGSYNRAAQAAFEAAE